MANMAKDWQSAMRAAGHHNVASHDISTCLSELTRMDSQRPCSLSSYPPPAPPYIGLYTSVYDIWSAAPACPCTMDVGCRSLAWKTSSLHGATRTLRKTACTMWNVSQRADSCLFPMGTSFQGSGIP